MKPYTTETLFGHSNTAPNEQKTHAAAASAHVASGGFNFVRNFRRRINASIHIGGPLPSGIRFFIRKKLDGCSRETKATMQISAPNLYACKRLA